MGQKVVKTFTSNGTFVAPGGVYRVTVKTRKLRELFVPGPVAYIDHQNNIWSWGLNTAGMVGDLSTTDRNSPVLVFGRGTRFKNLFYTKTHGVGSRFSTSAIDYLGNVYNWGVNNLGHLGDLSVTPKSSPNLISNGSRIYRKTFPAVSSTHFLDVQGNLYGSGGNTAVINQGGLGDGTLVNKSSPTLVVGGNTYRDAFISDSTKMGLDFSGNLYAWGGNADGQLGVGDVTSRSSPTLVLGGISWRTASITNVSTGWVGSTYGIAQDGSLYAWGGNANGQLGVGDVTPRSSPVLVSAGPWAKVWSDKAINYALAIDEDGALYSWGINDNGELGLGDVTPRSTPTLVSSGPFVDVKTVHNNTWALRDNGEIYSWGLNSRGELGVGDTTPRSTPTLVSGGLTFRSMFPVQNYGTARARIFAFTTDKALYSWGDNNNGDLGVGDTVARSVPTLVSTVNQVAEDYYDEVFQFNVTPGQSYSVVLDAYVAKFGSSVVGTDYPEIMEIEYEQ